jgi:cytochrome c oxidase assembly protein subunit 15
MFNSPENRKPSFRLALLGVALALVVIVLGAFTRLVDAGLGCPDWPGCYGHVSWPTHSEEIAAANAAFPDAPVEIDKTWPEMVHRYFATGLGMLAIGLVGMSLRHRRAGQPLKLPLFLLAIIILQGMFGMWTVTLKLWPQVVTAHLLGGFTTLSLLWLMTLRLNNSHWTMPMALRDRFKPLAMMALLMVIAQIALGGWTTSNYAAVACPDLPTCQAQWFPAMDFANGFNLFQSIGPNYLGGIMTNEARVAIHMSHRIGAILTLVYVGWLCWKLLRSESSLLQGLGKVTGAVLVVQFCLGLGNVFFQFPLIVAVSHNAVGALLLLTLVTLNYRLITARESS